MAARIMVGAPVVSGALAVFPIGRDEDPSDGPDILTLPEALDAGLAVMRETGRVQEVELFVRDDRPVLCLAGEIVLGGRQDRLVAADMVVTRRSGKVRVPAFCIERERWRRRGQESQVRFCSSTRAAPSSLRRLLTEGACSQKRVWQHVLDTQRCLSFVSSAGASVRDSRSRTSLALSLARPELDLDLNELVEPMLALPDEDVVGHAVVIGGRLSHAELFGSPGLHNRVFRQLIESATVDAPDVDGARWRFDEVQSIPLRRDECGEHGHGGGQVGVPPTTGISRHEQHELTERPQRQWPCFARQQRAARWLPHYR